MPKVSIVIPTIGRKFFKYSYLAAISQTYKDIEIIVCDYGNSDYPQEILADLPDKRVKYYKFEDPGRLEGYRKGIEISNGEYVKLLLDDDMITKNAIEIMVKILDENKNVTLVSSRRYVINENNEKIRIYRSPFSEDTVMKGIFAGNTMLYNTTNFIGEPSTVLFRREELKEPYGRFSGIDALCNDDVASWLNLLTIGDLYFIATPLAYFRIHSGQVQEKPEFKAKAIIDWITHILKSYDKGFLRKDKMFYKVLYRIANAKEIEPALENSLFEDKIKLTKLLNDIITILKVENIF